MKITALSRIYCQVSNTYNQIERNSTRKYVYYNYVVDDENDEDIHTCCNYTEKK